MSTTEKEAGNLLPQVCPEVGRFIQAQNHIREAIGIIDNIRCGELPQLPKKKLEQFMANAMGITDALWDVDSDIQDLLHDYLAPLFPLTHNQ